ncbi:hypothetical protein PVBG_04014 [Plasmodium vivax Brazil I]|uniref:VIR protein n=1 Tax=Plasmodium vivax (strain Brazil I) TaxID=1033975 RepID=A0A0J9SWK3_PLAV1|nr:hypothetical protein PVBG_04014 [Plasmodium vivax Brazil I]
MYKHIFNYIDFKDYIAVRNKLNKCNYNYVDEDRFRKILARTPYRNSVNWNDKIFACLHSYLTHNNGYMVFSVKDYCRYINFWLNGEVRKPENQNYQQRINIFEDFVDNYAHAQQGNDKDSCKKYIHYMDEADYGRMKYLYEFYDFYDELRHQNYWRKTNPCDKVLNNSFIYSRAIEDYYEKYPDLYAKISPVRDLIDEIINKGPKHCEQTVYFRIPPKFLKDKETKLQEEAEKLRIQQEEAEKLRIQQEEAEKLRIQQEEAENRSKQQEAELEAQKGKLQMPTTLHAQREIFHQREQLLSREQETSREGVNLGAHERSKVLTHRRGSDNSGIFEDLKEPGLGLYEGQSEEIVHAPGNEDTNPDGSFLGSLRLPSAITEVLGSVDPVPVVGVSGGMGALFLLFRVFNVLKIYPCVYSTFKQKFTFHIITL